MDIKSLYEVTKNLSVLYVEDDPYVLEQYTRFFRKFFNHVNTAVDGKEALDKYDQYKKENNKNYDLIISDITMPNMTGIELSENILKKEPTQQILIVSAHNESSYLQSLMDLGVHNFIHKPMSMDSMIKVLDKICTYINKQKANKEKVERLENTIKKLKEDYENSIKDKLTYEEDMFGLYSLLETYEITSLIDKDGEIIETNTKFESISGYKKQELLGMNFDFFRDEEQSKQIWDAIKNSNIFRGEIKNHKKDSDEEYWTDVILVPMVRDGHIFGYKIIEEDITEDKKVDTLLHDIISDDDIDLDFKL
jgi:PAS domain S-box-containing protein